MTSALSSVVSSPLTASVFFGFTASSVKTRIKDIIQAENRLFLQFE